MPSLFVVVSPSAIVPGQPFAVRWTVCPDGLTDGGSPSPARVSLSLNGMQVPMFEAEAGSEVRPAPTGNIPLDRFRVRAIPGFYVSGTAHPVEMVARLADGTTLRGSAVVRVAAPPAPTVVFTNPSAVGMSRFPGDVRAVAWKSRYNVNATVTNVSPFASATGTVSLQEAENTRTADGMVTDVVPGPSAPVASGSAALAPGASGVVSFAPVLVKDWAWLREPTFMGSPGLWELMGPLERGFTYRLAPVGRDEFGNVIGGGAVAIRVDVSVSQEKRNFQIAAQNLANLALAVSPLLGPFLVGRALHPEEWWPVFIYQAAGAQGRNALDPPDPDPRFADEVPIEEITFPKILEEEKELPDLREWVRAALHFGEVRTAMYAVEGKYLGALLEKDEKAQAAQLDRYRLFVNYLRRDATILAQRSLPAAKAVTERMSDAQIEAWLTAFADSSLSKEEAAHLLALVPAAAGDGLRAIVKAFVTKAVSVETLLDVVTRSLNESVANVIDSSLQRYDELNPNKQT